MSANKYISKPGVEPIDPDAATFEVTITKEEHDIILSQWLDSKTEPTQVNMNTKDLHNGAIVMIHGKQWTLESTWEISKSSEEGDTKELLYVFEGWGDIDLKLTEAEVGTLIDEGEFAIK